MSLMPELSNEWSESIDNDFMKFLLEWYRLSMLVEDDRAECAKVLFRYVLRVYSAPA